ncbi:DNA repair protein SWI5 homolog [Macrobrachium nipponense]|uniref:DNA repair protein SWI5 homolog n=1 Tax=Macrobrachium nipponense TaxID=159736 RepID=UPI0030C8746E
MSFHHKEHNVSGKISCVLKVQQPFKSPMRGSGTNKEELKSTLGTSTPPVLHCRKSKHNATFSPNHPILQESQENKESGIAKNVDEKASLNTTPRKQVGNSSCSGRLSRLGKFSPCQFSVPFRSPISNNSTGQQVLSQEEDLDKLIKLERDLEEEISSLQDLGFEVEELQGHISNLHRYNEIKDAAQLVMGRLAELEGVTVKEIHEKYGVTCLE